MKIKDAEAITHSLSKPGKMPGYAYSTPAHGIDFKMLKMHNIKDSERSSIHCGPGPWLFKSILKKLNILDGTTQATCRTWNTFKRFLKCASSRRMSSTGCQRARRGRRTILKSVQKI